MRRILMCVVVLSLIASGPAGAQSQTASAKVGVAKSPAKAVKPAPAAEPAAEEKNKTEVMAELQQLRQILLEQSREMDAQRVLLQEQQRRMQELERQVAEQGAASATNGAAAEAARAEDLKLAEGQLEAVADNQKELGDRVRTVQTDITNTNRANDGRFRQLGNFRFSGDLRARMEPFIQRGNLDRVRYRVRARFNLQGNITDELFGGISLATGTLDDPVSTNQTLTGFFNRKNVGFDRLFITYKPKWLKNHATFGAGKFPYPWVRTPLTFDNDVNPEGFSQQLSWDFKNSVFKNLTLVNFQLPLFERSGTISTSGATAGQVTTPGFDAWVFGGQVQTRWKLGNRVNLALHLAGVNFINSDLIASNLGGQLIPSLANTNTLRTNASGATIGYASRFLYLDTIAQMDIRTNWSKWPITFLFNFENNVRATRIVQTGTAAPTGQVDNPERSAYWAEIQFGRQQEAKDWQFGYAFIRVEKDAVIAAFNESDLRSATNVSNHRLNANYQALRNVNLNWTLWVGRLTNAQDNTALVPARERLPGSACATSPFTGCKDPFLKRMQMDLIYRF